MKAQVATAALLAALLWQPTLAQDASVRGWLREINRDVWAPFMAGVKQDDASLYLGVLRQTSFRY